MHLLLAVLLLATGITVTLSPTSPPAYGTETVTVCRLNPNDGLRLYWQFPQPTSGYPPDFGALSTPRVGARCYSYPINLAQSGTYLLDAWVTDHQTGVESQVADTTFSAV